MNMLLTQEQALGLGTDALGGKAAHLAELTRAGLAVPRWAVLTTQAWALLLQQLGLHDQIQRSMQGIHRTSSFQEIEVAAHQIQSLWYQATFPDDLRHPLKTWLTGREDLFLAVRSSVVGEDAEGASFAGQMDSLLFQRGLGHLEAAILHVAASAYNARALQYRLTRGLPLDDIRSAIILQDMVDGEVSGVMFTAHPVTGQRDQALISATWGLGEGLVSGLCNADDYSVGLFDSHIKSQIAEKDTALIFDHAKGQGTCESTVDLVRRQEPCLSPENILNLRDIGLRIAHLQRAPQDIEWTYRQGQFFILQTRPITQLPAPQETTPLTVFDNANIQESYCGVTTPLTFSFASQAYATVYEQTMRILGISEHVIEAHRSMLGNMLGLLHGRIYYNINNWYRGLLLLPSFRTNKADMERMMGLTQPVDLIQDTTFSWREKLHRLPQVLRALFHLFLGFQNMEARVRNFREHFENVYAHIDRNLLHTLDSAALVSTLKQLDLELLQRWTTPIINDFYVMMMNGRVHRTLVAAGFSEPSLLQNNLLSGEEGIESTEPTKMLLRMCAYLRLHPPARALVEASDQSMILARLQILDPTFYEQCQAYIECYGDRCMGELKLESMTLRQDPSFLFAILRNYLTRDDLGPDTLTLREAGFRSEAEAQAFARIKERLGSRPLRRFQHQLQQLRHAVRYRESMRLARTRLFGLYRDIFLELGQQLASSAYLTQARDIFYLTLDEIYALHDGRAIQTNLPGLVQLRQQEYARYSDQEPGPQVWTYGMANHPGPYHGPEEDSALSADGLELKGTGCYPGIVEAPVRLIFSPEDELSLNGQILCTMRTDPGWAPLFPTVGGLLVERGSTLSHSAVVARELGIPAIVGIPGITRCIKDGEHVRMDGSSGKIIRQELRSSS
ncbi:MAG: phosphoenolpyruvate synthase [Pseudomonadales bacterium]|nr:phosphoenolpyruvate synthase [Pseudomonadales bacterium]